MILTDAFNRKNQRKQLFENFPLKKEEKKDTIIFLEGGSQTARYDTDQDIPFHQEANFFHLTGLQSEPDCFAALHLEKQEFVLFCPELNDEYELWCGPYPKKQDYKTKIGVDKVVFLQDMEKFLTETWKVKKVYTLKKIPSVISKLKNITIDSKQLYITLKDLRLIKTADEIPHQRKVCEITAQAHKFVMENAYPGMNECEGSANLNYYSFKNGCKHMAFMTIAAGGSRQSTLHYVRNDQIIKNGDLLLLDGGSYYNGYCGDVTRTYPVNGKFTEKQKNIYSIVLKANKTVISKSKPGLKWTDLHIISERVIAQGLLDLGILKGDLEKDIIKNHVQAYFYPHGLGHSLGLDTHDPPNKDGTFEIVDRPSLRNLRIRTELKEGMVLTVEPGCYFNKMMMENAKKDDKVNKFINFELIEKEYKDFGGVRIEDDILITKDGCENFTISCPKEIKDIESLMKKKSD